MPTSSPSRKTTQAAHDGKTHWHKDAIIYEVNLRAFQDSNEDGVGDFPGLIDRLDYLQDLGVNTLWLMPFFPSPLRDDGYDISDFKNVHPEYGNLADFKRLVKEAHARGLRVIIELVIAHTSDEHPWFQAERAAPKNKRNFYLWSETGREYPEARVIFDSETSNWAWDSQAEAYYWHRFYSHQPALNFENPKVRKEVLNIVDFWLKLGVDGVRLDAVSYLFQAEGTTCENLPQVHDFLREVRGFMESSYKDRILLADANLWPEDAAAYFGQGDECHMAFHFPLMPRLFMALHMEDRFPVIDILEQTPDLPEGAQWGIFLRNHDDLTLEMVTDEERDYMYRMYAGDERMRVNSGIRRRLAPLLGFNRRRMELLNALLFSLPGSPCLYYGDEIGMGDNIYLGDRNSVRTPMQWSPDRNGGFSRANAQQLYAPTVVDPEAHFESVNVESQMRNPHSFGRWVRRLIALRRRYHCFGHGDTEFLHLANPKILAFIRSGENEKILVIANLSRFVQEVDVDLTDYSGWTPTEVFGRQEFHQIPEDGRYYLTLGPHSFYWFELRPPKKKDGRPSQKRPPLKAEREWQELLQPRRQEDLVTVLENWMPQRRWYGGKARRMKQVSIAEILPLPGKDIDAMIAFVQVEYAEGATDNYVMPLSFARGADAGVIEASTPHAAITRVVFEKDGSEGLIYDASAQQQACSAFLRLIEKKKSIAGRGGELHARQTPAFKKLRGDEELTPKASRAEQSNTSIIYGDRMIMKIFRRPDEGINPDLEICRFLTNQNQFHNIAYVAGSLEYAPQKGDSMTVAMLQSFASNEGDAWEYTLDELGRYIERVISEGCLGNPAPVPDLPPFDLAKSQPPALFTELAGHFPPLAALLGRRTGEMHAALANSEGDADFAPVKLDSLYQRSLAQSFRNHTNASLQLLKRKLRETPEGARASAEWVLEHSDLVRSTFASLSRLKATSMRTRIHGDYHLGQVLFTGRDFVIIDFEGEPSRSIGERRLKRSPLRDVAGMLRSFQYAAFTGLRAAASQGLVTEQELPLLGPWVEVWQRWISAIYLRDYLDAASKSNFLPDNETELRLLLVIFQLNKALYEVTYELNNRPDWVATPLSAVRELLQEANANGREP
ncbi:MAG: maltose alpha-D-glucosyltransferase [Sumerlaeia bacterium]